MRPLLISGCLLLLVSLPGAEDAPKPAKEVPLPAAVQTALAKYTDAVESADKEAFLKKQKAQTDVVKVLEKAQQDATKAGNLDLALALRDRRAAIENEQQANLLTDSPDPVVPTTAAQWDKLPGRVVKITASQPLELGDLPATASFRIVPHPTDTWKEADAEAAVGYAGKPGTYNLNLLPQMALLLVTDGKDAVVNPSKVYQGGGKCALRANALFMPDNVGTMRVKIVPAKP
jgi:hypothetical protein